MACIRGLGRPKAEGDRDATLQLVSRAQESSSGDLAALFVEDTTDDTQPLEVAVIDLEEHVTPALKTRHERDGDARACLLALLRPQTRVSVSKSTTPHKKGKRPPALLLRETGDAPTGHRRRRRLGCSPRSSGISFSFREDGRDANRLPAIEELSRDPAQAAGNVLVMMPRKLL